MWEVLESRLVGALGRIQGLLTRIDSRGDRTLDTGLQNFSSVVGAEAAGRGRNPPNSGERLASGFREYGEG